MKKVNLFIVILFCLAANVFCQKKEENEAKMEKVCCETFGYGSLMIKCCQTYEIIPKDQCKVEEGVVGGGKQVVDISFCKKK